MVTAALGWVSPALVTLSVVEVAEGPLQITAFFIPSATWAKVRGWLAVVRPSEAIRGLLGPPSTCTSPRFAARGSVRPHGPGRRGAAGAQWGEHREKVFGAAKGL